MKANGVGGESKVVLAGLEFHARHGVYDSEALLGSRFIIDIELEYPFAGIDDDIDKAVNYAEVYTLVQDEVTGRRYLLLEVVADRIAQRILREHPQLESVLVRVHKPFAPLPGIFRNVYSEVVLHRTQVESQSQGEPQS